MLPILHRMAYWKKWNRQWICNVGLMRSIQNRYLSRMATLFVTVVLILAHLLISPLANTDHAESSVLDLGNISQRINISAEEKEWLSKNHSIRIRVAESPPYHSWDEGKAWGISVDYISSFCELFRLNCVFVKNIPWREAVENIGSGKDGDIILTIRHTSDREKFILFTDDYISPPWVIFSRMESSFIGGIEDLRGKTVSVEESFIIGDLIKQDVPSVQLVPFSTSKEAVEALATGRVDAYVGGLTIGSYLVSRWGLNNVKVAAPTPFGLQYQAMGVRKDWPELTSLLNRFMAALTEDERSKIRGKWLSVPYEQGVDWPLMLKVIGSIVGIAIVVSGFFILSNRRLREEANRRMVVEGQLWRLSERNRLLLQTASDGIHIVDVQGNIVEVSDRFCQMLGYTRAEVVNMNVVEWAVEHPPTVVTNNLLRVLEQHETLTFETNFRRKDGSFFDAEISLCSIELDGQKLVHAAARDITSRKKMEQILRDNESRFSSAMEAINDGLWDWNIPSDKAYFSPAYFRMLGYEPDELSPAGQSWASLIHPEDRQTALSANQACIENRCETFTTEFRMKAKDGSWRWILGRGRALERNADGRAVRMIGTHVDITEPRRIKEKLEENEKRLKVILDGAADAIFIADQQARYIYTNESASRLLGYDHNELLCMSIADITPIEDWPQIQTTFQNLLLTGSMRGEIRLKAKDGCVIPVDINSTLLPDGSVCGFCRDITERKRVEAELLESRSAAEAASLAKSAFLANMSHEIRTPLNAIVGFTEAMCQEYKDNTTNDKLKKIDTAASHLLAIINDILDMSKIEAGKLFLKQDDFFLRDLLERVKGHFLPQAEGKNLELRLEVDPKIPDRLFGDDLRLKQCLMNYLSNAMKFTTSGSVTIKASLKNMDGSGCLLHFEVEDSGIGIEHQALPRLFTPFEQANTSTTRNFGGSGLGLALTKQLVYLMGGEVGVDSTVGKGSRFWFTARLQLAAEVEVKADGRSVAVPTQDFSNARVLAVEDIEMNRDVLKLMLDKLGVQVDVAVNGQDAVNKAKANSYDFILMDIRMPLMDGLSATRIIRTLPDYAETPIIALTANAFEDDRRSCLDAGMNDFLSKPLRFETLQTVLSKWLIWARQARPEKDVKASGSAELGGQI